MGAVETTGTNRTLRTPPTNPSFNPTPTLTLIGGAHKIPQTELAYLTHSKCGRLMAPKRQRSCPGIGIEQVMGVVCSDRGVL